MMNEKSIVGTFNVPTPDELEKTKIRRERGKAAREAAVAKKKAKHRSYVVKYIIFIGLCLLGAIYMIKGYICVCNDWFDLYFTQVDVFTGIIAGGIIGVFYFGIVGAAAYGFGYGLFKMFKLKK